MTTARDIVASKLGKFEFTAMISMIMAVVALAIDMMLPAFSGMRADFGIAQDSNALAPVVTFFFIGLAVGQPLWGPLSDAIGRKRVMYIGLVIYVLSAVAATFAPTPAALFAVRFVGGFGAAGPRVVALSVVRDVYEGEAMARVLSFIMAVFLLIPILAPSLGAVILELGSWHLVFWTMAVFGVAVGVWSLRLPETLSVDRRLPLRPRRLWVAAKLVFANRLTMGFVLARTAMFGFFTTYLASSQLIYDDVFGLGDWFPVIFGASAAVLGVGMLANTRLLDRVPLRELIRRTFVVHLAASLLLGVIVLASGGHPSFAVFAVAFLPLLIAYALLIPNLNSAAMLPMGAVAGTASAVVGSISLLGGAIIGSFIDRSYDGSLLPFGIAAIVLGAAAYLAYRWADHGWEGSTKAVELPIEAT